MPDTYCVFAGHLLCARQGPTGGDGRGRAVQAFCGVTCTFIHVADSTRVTHPAFPEHGPRPTPTERVLGEESPEDGGRGQ